MSFWQILLTVGIPSTIFGAIISFVVWFFQKQINKNEKKIDEKEKDLESMILLMLQSTRANTILCQATAEAVRDGHCNGNMTAALETVKKAAEAEKEFLYNRSIKYIFE